MSIHWWTGKPKEVPPYKRILFRHKKERSIDPSYNTGGILKTWCSVREPRHKWSVWCHLYEMCQTGKSMGREVHQCLPEAGERREWSVVAHGYRDFLFSWSDKKHSGITQWWWLHNSVNIPKANGPITLSWILWNVNYKNKQTNLNYISHATRRGLNSFYTAWNWTETLIVL